MIPCALPRDPRIRVSPDPAWPLRCADGRTFAERKAAETTEKKGTAQ